MPCCGQQVGTKAYKSRLMTFFDRQPLDEGTDLPTQLYSAPPPSLLTIVGSAVATIVFDTYVINWVDIRDEGKTNLIECS